MIKNDSKLNNQANDDNVKKIEETPAVEVEKKEVAAKPAETQQKV